ncbi:MAG: VCBS repeat-containing protein [Actinomycetota bacterium]|nr:VCBS repeat-containing protein [Actinomycetota bacterium]
MLSKLAVAGALATSVAALLMPTATPASAEEAVTGHTVVDRAAAVGLRTVGVETYTATPVDYNRDGRQDVWIGYHGHGGRLWKNRGNGTYARVARTAWPSHTSHGGKIDRHDCAWADVDRNGLLDAYCSTGRMEANVVKGRRGNELWLQRRPGVFRETARQWGVRDACGRGRQVVFFDANGDRYPDIFLGNDTPRDDPDDPCNVARNNLPNERSKVFVNVRGTGFRYVRRGWSLPAGVGTLCAFRLDFDRDGWDDLFTCRPPGQAPRLYRNQHGRGFANVTARHGLNSQISGATLADLDLDGDQDVVTASNEGFGYHPNDGGRFRPLQLVAPIATGQGRSVAVADIDSDGDQDLYGMVGQGRSSNPDDQIWVNDGSAFTPLSVPPAEGAADEVVALTPSRGRRPAFLVLNGFGPFEHGPVQFIQVLRR